MSYDVIIVGGGAAGLTAAAFLAKSGRSTLLLEQQAKCGGLVNSFRRGDFIFDGGIRALENAGVLFPMIKQLGIDVELIRSRVSLGIEDKVIAVESSDNLEEYENLLKDLYPESAVEISAIMREIEKITRFMDIQYGINNPLFLDVKANRDYFIKEVFPWMFKYMFNVPKVSARNRPVVQHLQKFTDNQALIDIIAQHFFRDTPAYFALSYFRLYCDYYYPKGGTGVFTKTLAEFIRQKGGEIRTGAAVRSINLEKKTVKTDQEEIGYKQLLWAADQKTLYKMIDLDQVDQKTVDIVAQKQASLEHLSGNDSVLTLYLFSDLDKKYFRDISAGHFFYTPSRKGQSLAGSPPKNGSWEAVKAWLDLFLAYTTYEISIPALRDESMAPPGKTGLIVSVLFDYQLTKYIVDQGWGERFSEAVTEMMINALDQTIYPGLKASVFDSFTATPVTLQKITGNTDGAITGWSFTNPSMPAENRLVRISNAVKTPLADVTQAGQWTYSPSGFPVSLITGKLAADRVNKLIK